MTLAELAVEEIDIVSSASSSCAAECRSGVLAEVLRLELELKLKARRNRAESDVLTFTSGAGITVIVGVCISFARGDGVKGTCSKEGGGIEEWEDAVSS
jgi:hypothetical protein